MLRNITKTVGSAMAALCLVSTLALAQAQSPGRPQSQPMPPEPATTSQQGHKQDAYPMLLTCSADDGKGNCTAAKGVDGKSFVVVGEGLKTGAAMSCVDRGNVVNCKPAS
jgi:hypothetical protein